MASAKMLSGLGGVFKAQASNVGSMARNMEGMAMSLVPMGRMSRMGRRSLLGAVAGGAVGGMMGSTRGFISPGDGRGRMAGSVRGGFGGTVKGAIGGALGGAAWGRFGR